MDSNEKNKMKRAYNRLFYAIMLNYMKLHSGNELPKWDDLTVAVVILSCILYCDILTLSMLLETCGVYHRVYANSIDSFLAVIILVFNAVYFIRKKNYQSIYEYYQKEEDVKTHKRRSWYCLSFVLISVVLMFVAAYFYDKTSVL